MPPVPGTPTRRELLRAGGRGLAWAALAGVAAVLGARALRSARTHISPGSQRCIHHGLCAGCPAARTCRLPQGQSFRRWQRENVKR